MDIAQEVRVTLGGRFIPEVKALCDLAGGPHREGVLEEDWALTKAMSRDLSEFAGIGIALLQREKIIYWNAMFAKMLGEPSGETTSLEALFARLHPDDFGRVANAFEALFAGSRTSSAFECRTGRGGEQRHYRGYAGAIDYRGNPAVYCFMEDISHKLEPARCAERNEIRMIHGDRLTTLGTMAAGMAHELNQPLNTIRVITDGILFGRDKGWVIDPEELFDDLNMVSRQVSRMSSIISYIRDFARRDYDLNLVDVDVNQAVENVFSMLGRQLEAHGIHVRKELGWDVGRLRTQQTRLEQVIINLLVNAQEALDECEHENKEIWLQTGKINGRISIELGDNGIGIPESLGDRIFEPYLTTKDVGKGTGLGLSISKSIVVEMGGHIEHFNNKQGGATFLVTFPERGKW